MAKTNASSGHKLGQIIGDWFEEYFAFPVLQKAADQLSLYLDCRFKKRECRGERIIWKDVDGNLVDYDFVMEMGGSEKTRGTPVAFFETFWRKGTRHSKDKARDDSGKLLPMKATFPTARVLGVVSAGDFTGPARELLLSRGIDLFYIEKQKIINAWEACGLQIDYADKSSEEVKYKVAYDVIAALEKDESLYSKASIALNGLVGLKSLESYIYRLVGKIGALPQTYSIQVQSKSAPIQFEKYIQVDRFLNSEEPNIEEYEVVQYYGYQVDFFDGDEFFRENLSWFELRELHNSLKELVQKME